MNMKLKQLPPEVKAIADMMIEFPYMIINRMYFLELISEYQDEIKAYIGVNRDSGI